LADRTCLFDGIAQLLAKAKSLGIPWGIVTNKPMRFTDALVPLIGLESAACVISGDTTPHPKPHPLPLLTAARQLGVDPEACVYIGDDLRDIQAGKAAGMATIAAGWGYAPQGEPYYWGADLVALTPAKLDELLFPAAGQDSKLEFADLYAA
jgi:phosphoglycolate phosphatase